MWIVRTAIEFGPPDPDSGESGMCVCVSCASLSMYAYMDPWAWHGSELWAPFS